MKNKYQFKILILLLIFSFYSSCNSDYNSVTKYTIKNDSGVNLKIIQMYGILTDTISLVKDASYFESVSLEGGGIGSLFHCDSMQINLNSSKKIIYTWLDNSKRNLLHTENYIQHQISENEYEMYYTFTEQDYLDADSIK